MEAVVAYLDSVDAEAAAAARSRYSCFDHVGSDGARYGHALSLNLRLPCEKEVVAQLVDLRRRQATILERDGWAAEDEFFYAEQNARLVLDAEEYYREMYRARVSSWNLRDRHMATVLGRWSLISTASSVERVWSCGSTTLTLVRTALWDEGEPPETFPTGL